MSPLSLRTVLHAGVAGSALLVIGVGCSTPPDEEHMEVDTDQQVGMNAKTGAVISSSSGYIGDGSGGIVEPGFDPGPYQPVVACYWPCTKPSEDATSCSCPAGYGYEGSIVCPASAPYPRYVWGSWRCSSVPPK